MEVTHWQGPITHLVLQGWNRFYTENKKTIITHDMLQVVTEFTHKTDKKKTNYDIA